MRPADAPALARELDHRILEFIAASRADDATFERLALDLFAYQYQANQPYRTLCDRMRRTPDNVNQWTDIPAVSTASFADVRLACFPPERTRLRFVSSGTTRSSGRPSVHELETSDLYEASLEAQFRRRVMPDRERMNMLFLSPSFVDAPASSLAFMCSRLFERCAAGGGFYIRDGRLVTDALIAALRESSEPTLVFGTAFGFVHFLDACKEQSLRFTLPANSRLVETGGFKGKSRAVQRDELYAALVETFGIPPDWCASEYGMCELTSQWYDANLSDAIAGRPPRTGLKLGPAWTRFFVVDPISAEPVEDGREGLLSVLDLSNRGSVAAVLTGDVVRKEGEGFRFIGRSTAAPPKGCSISVDSMLRSRA